VLTDSGLQPYVINLNVLETFKSNFDNVLIDSVLIVSSSLERYDSYSMPVVNALQVVSDLLMMLIVVNHFCSKPSLCCLCVALCGCTPFIDSIEKFQYPGKSCICFPEFSSGKVAEFLSVSVGTLST